MHRYVLVYMYYKHRKKAASSDHPPGIFAEDQLPTVTVQLPIFNEQFVIDRLVDAVTKMQYPREKLHIQVLDDSTDETVQVASAIVERYQALGHNIAYIHRDNRQGFKAGAFKEGMAKDNSELLAIFDADFVPPEDWLMRVVHHFTDPGVGMVQTRWTHLNRNYSFLTNVEAILLDGHFVLEHGGRSRGRRLLQFQRHRWHVATPGDRGRWRLGTGHSHRRH